MNNYRYSGCRNHSKEEESVFFTGILWTKEHASARIIENGLSFFKPAAMVATITSILSSHSKRSNSILYLDIF